ncbi:MAG: alpha/beta fold hydrolase [Flavobacteriaceae bacterium]|jgi:predicted alpha/beta-fold hydrolase|nr:alpha/beta fold hydrolase [Flavobacteriaceae bacterium]
MPLVESQYKAPSFWHQNPHFSTIYSGRIKKATPPLYQRQRIELEDGDFLDIDFVLKSAKRAVVLCHGLEGGSDRTYNNTSADYFLKRDFSVFAWNNRSCSGEMNRLPKLYHHGAVEDFSEMVNFVLDKGFDEIYLMGFSMGGAQVMNYLGSSEMDSRIRAAVAVSTPIQLKSSAEALKKGFNQVYLKNFTRKISKKLKSKSLQHPDALDWSKLKMIRSFDEIDEFFTAPLHGFSGREDYYKRASPAYVMEKIQTPVLLLNALDDPFLGTESFPFEFAENNPFIYLETPRNGGHCAFPVKNSYYAYSEIRAHEFFMKKP